MVRISYENLYGWVPEWPKGADCKSVSSAFGGSNPPSPTLPEHLDAQERMRRRHLTCVACTALSECESKTKHELSSRALPEEPVFNVAG